MKQLMIHVEKIVRPVRAMQFRKLRMRRELLAHVQAAFEEERAAGADESAALERSMRRLGDPVDLTRTLQQSVPWLERTLMARVPATSLLDRMERHSEGTFGLDRSVTMLHSAIIVLGGTVVAYLALLLAALAMSPREMLGAMLARPRDAVIMNLVNVVAILVLVTTCTKLMFDIARGRGLRNQLIRIACVVLMPAVTMCVTIAATAQRGPTVIETIRSGIIGLALLLTCLSLAQIVARLRRPYDPWLTLDLAE